MSAKTPHVHAAVIKAWADGAEIQCKSKSTGKWVDLDAPPVWWKDYEHRVKPEPKPDIMNYFHISLGENTGKVYATPQYYSTHANVKVVFDGETAQLKSVELI